MSQTWLIDWWYCCSGQAFRRTKRSRTNHWRSVVDGHRVRRGWSYGCTRGVYPDLRHRSVFSGEHDWTSAHRVDAEDLLSSVVDRRQPCQSVVDRGGRCWRAVPSWLRYVCNERTNERGLLNTLAVKRRECHSIKAQNTKYKIQNTPVRIIKQIPWQIK